MTGYIVTGTWSLIHSCLFSAGMLWLSVCPKFFLQLSQHLDSRFVTSGKVVYVLWNFVLISTDIWLRLTLCFNTACLCYTSFVLHACFMYRVYYGICQSQIFCWRRRCHLVRDVQSEQNKQWVISLSDNLELAYLS